MPPTRRKEKELIYEIVSLLLMTAQLVIGIKCYQMMNS